LVDVVVETTEGTVTILGQYAQQQAQWHEALEWAKDHVDEDLPTGEMMKQMNELAEAYMEAGGAPAGYGDDDEGADGDGYAPAYQQNLTPMPPDPDPQPFDHEDPKAFKKVMASFYMTLVKKPVQPKKG
jgi:hypothetical protein